MKKYIVVNSNDNVAVAVTDLSKDTVLDIGVTLSEDIKRGHKFALEDIDKNQDIIKYNMPIGHATEDIKKGQWVHVHNVKTNLSDLISYNYNKKSLNGTENKKDNLTFKGYLRDDGRAGVRNDIWIVPTVGCINQVCKNIQKLAEKKYPQIDFETLEHTHGCSQLGDDLETTQKILAGLINNPNAGGVLVLSLGCENNVLEKFKKYLEPINEDRIKFMIVQQVDDEYENGMRLIDELVEYVDKFERQDLSIEKLTIGFKCGGSDGLSGLTANPLCGYASDKLVDNGATTMLTEVPEMFGAETILMNRAKDERVFNDIVGMINNFKEYFKSYNQTIYENPSPGNKDGGITTLEDKSLGCIQKGGNSEVVGVLQFGEQAKTNGLNLLNGPGNDQVSSTNLAASGCNIIVFTTGRGNPFGSIVPTIKVSSNSELAERKKNWIDFNAGVMVDREINFEELRDEFIDYIIRVASGELTKNEEFGFREISIFKDGVIL